MIFFAILLQIYGQKWDKNLLNIVHIFRKLLEGKGRACAGDGGRKIKLQCNIGDLTEIKKCINYTYAHTYVNENVIKVGVKTDYDIYLKNIIESP